MLARLCRHFQSVIPGRAEGASPESISTDGDYGFRARRHSRRSASAFFSTKNGGRRPPTAPRNDGLRWLAVAYIVLGIFASTTARAEETLTVFAAASLKNALDDVDAAFARATGIKMAASYAASSALAKQIEQGAPADVFASADLDWMDYAHDKKLIKDATRIDLLGNRLVLIAAKDSALAEVAIGPGFDLAALAGDGRIVTGDVRAVPVGRYARAALEKLGAWQKAESKMAMAENVRAALALVARGEAPLGIVYATDAKVEPGVKIIGRFPADSHPRIVYPFAATATAKPQAERYLGFLRSPAAKTVFERYGFTVLAKPTS